MEYKVNESVGTLTPILTLSRPTPCCINVYCEVKDISATG